jgi:hypothetical protein
MLAAALGASLCLLPACGTSSEPGEGAPPLARRDANGTYVADYLEAQGGAATLNRHAERATLVTQAAQQTASGKRAERDLRFLIAPVRPGRPAGFEISTSGFTALDCSSAVLHSRSSRTVAYRLLIYKNPRRVKLLYESKFRSDRQSQALHVPLDGAVDVWLVWQPLNDQAQPSAEFLMAAPRLTGVSA